MCVLLTRATLLLEHLVVLLSLSLQYPDELALIGAVAWCMLVSFSRIYLGMHSVLVSY